VVLVRVHHRHRRLRLAVGALFRATGPDAAYRVLRCIGGPGVRGHQEPPRPAAERHCGHVLSGLVGVSCWQLFGGMVWLAAALAVSLAIVAMLATKTLHPPGGATALIAVIGGDKVHNLGFLYAFVPAGAGALVLLLVALIVNKPLKEQEVSGVLVLGILPFHISYATERPSPARVKPLSFKRSLMPDLLLHRLDTFRPSWRMALA